MSKDRVTARNPIKRTLLVCGLVLGICMAILPSLFALVGIARASGVPEGLRGATHMPAMQARVGFALGSASLTAILAPPGLLLAVFSALALASEKRASLRNPRDFARERDMD